MASQQILTRITAVEEVAENVRAYTLAGIDREPLPQFDAGAHIDLLLDNGMVRQYSLCGSCEAPDRYMVAILREVGGRGGSEYIHRSLETGDKLRISPPRNNFRLDEGGSNYLLIGGGIGITAIMPMASRLRQLGKNFELNYLCRSPVRAAFRDELARAFGGRIRFHYSYAEAGRRLNIGALVAEQTPGTQIYACGSEGVLQKVCAAAEARGDVRLKFERFTSAPADESAVSGRFEVELASNGEIISVPEDRSILEVLRGNGHEIDSMCEEGLCGSCEVGLLEGEADHRDSVLTDAEKAEQNVLMVCCSRALTPRLRLDL